MKDKGLENLLKDKLSGVEVKPPDGLWARIERDTAQARREEAFAPAPQTDISSKPEIRRPSRKRMSWAYVAASVALCGVIIASLNMIKDDMVSAYSGDGIENKPGSVDGMPEGIVIYDPATDSDILDIASPVKFPAITGAVKGGRLYAASHQVDARDEATVASPANEPAKDKPEDTSVPDGQDRQPDKGAVNEKRDNTTSDMKGRGGFAAKPPARAESGRMSRRTTPIAASLFAGNSGGLVGDASVTGGAMRMSSGFMVVENSTEPIPGGTVSSSASATYKLKHNYPLTFGINVGVGIVDRVSVQTGINYTFMKSESEQDASSGNFTVRVKQKLHYIGVPVAAKYDIVDHQRFAVYVSAGGAIEKCVSGVMSYENRNSSLAPEKEKLDVKGVQFSVGAGVGAELKIDKTFGIYAEPGIGYYFKNSKQPESYRTEHPLNFTLKAGLRINL